MALLFPDKRKAIIGQFFISDCRIRQNSRKAFLKIKSWKSSFTVTDDAEANYQLQFDNLVTNSFFNAVSNKYILHKEKFHERPTEN